MNDHQHLSAASPPHVGTCSKAGPVRSENEDACGYFSSPDGNEHLFVVADGMGGHSRGREASATALQVVERVFFDRPDAALEARLRTAFERANARVHALSESEGAAPPSQQRKRRAAGTTCTALAFSGGRFAVAHVGDSRLYRFDAQAIDQLTRDHTLVAGMVAEGVLTEEQAAHHPRRHVLERAVGVAPDLDVDVFHPAPLRAGDNGFLICSDGLLSLGEADVHHVVGSEIPQQACERLVERAYQAGSTDNATALVVRFGEE